MDLISVIMPFYKKREYFVQSFFSAVNQSYKNIEIIVIYDDDDVNDLKFIKNEVSKDPRVTIINNNSNYGVAKSRNIGIDNSKGKFIAFLDCDDVWEKNKLELQYNFMSKNKLRISHTSYNIINSKNEILGTNIAIENLTYNDLINSCDIGLSTVMVDRNIFKVSMFKDLKTKEDYALWLELSRKGEVFSSLNQTLTLWRRNSNSLSSSLIDKFINGFKVYNKFEKKNLFMSFFLVINLGLNYFKKRIKQKKKYMKKKIALISGVTGQDGSYLAELLLKKKYIVHGIKRKSSSFNTERIDHLYIDPHVSKNFFLHYGDLVDSNSLFNLVSKIKPDEIYNLGAQSHVGHSFEIPEYTSEVTGIGTLRLLEAIRFLNLKKTKFYQASTSELFGERNGQNSFNEKSTFVPKSPYGVSKLYSYWITKLYREAYGIYACNGILFNHESPRRGETFVTRKITMFLAKKIIGHKGILYLGNVYARRDWGHAKDYVEMQWRMLQNKKPKDYVIATGKSYTVKEFVNLCCKYLKLKIIWTGKGAETKAYLIKNNGKKELLIKVDKKYYRPADIDYLRGNPKKALKELKFKLKYGINDLVKEMMDEDIIKAKKNLI